MNTEEKRQGLIVYYKFYNFEIGGEDVLYDDDFYFRNEYFDVSLYHHI